MMIYITITCHRMSVKLYSLEPKERCLAELPTSHVQVSVLVTPTLTLDLQVMFHEVSVWVMPTLTLDLD